MGSSSGFRAKLSLTESLCGQTNYNLTLSNPTALIRSPGFDNYPSNTRCNWLFETTGDDIIRISFIQFDIRLSSLCGGDNVQIIDENVSAT